MFQVAIPMMGLAEVKEVIEDFISQFGEGFMDTPAELADSKHIRTDLNKSFFFDTSENERGSYVRISEVALPHPYGEKKWNKRDYYRTKS